MKKRTIKKSIVLEAPRETLWDVLFNDKFTRSWYGEFSEGCIADTDWKLGSKAIFSDNSKSGLIGKIIINNPPEILTVEYSGFYTNGVEDYESEIAQDIKGALETYRLTERDGKTQLEVEVDMGEDFFDSMSEAWDRALEKIKTFSESQQQLQA